MATNYKTQDSFKTYSKIFNSNINVILLNESITQISNVDAIVNCTGKRFEHEYKSGISKAIVDTAGLNMIQEFDKFLASKHKLEYGYVHQTPAFDLSNFQLVLHVCSPNIKETHFDKNTSINEVIFYNLFRKSFLELDLKSFATPLIGTGYNKIDVIDCINDFVEALYKFLSDFQNNSNAIKSDLFNKAQSVQQLPIGVLNENIKRCIYIVNKDSPVLALCKDVIANKLNFLNKSRPSSKLKLEPTPTIPVTSSNQSSCEETCVICMDKMTFPKKLKICNHEFCTDCIDAYFKNVKQTCPICNTVYNISEGTQPDGKMTHSILQQALPGFPTHTKTIEIVYSFPSGIQTSKHPNPGQIYHGISRRAYLPDTVEGRHVLDLFYKAFKYKLIFTIGQSRTTGQDNVITWNDIHHKTQKEGGSDNFGYPDSTYLQRVIKELAAKGVS